MRITALKDTRVGNKRVFKNETIDVPDKLALAFVRSKTFKEAGKEAGKDASSAKTPIGKSTEPKADKNQTYKTRQVKAEE